MILAIVKGNVVSSTKSERLVGGKLLVVEEWNADTKSTVNRPLVALDLVGAGPGELVMCVSGSSARQTEETEKRPVDLAIVGIVDFVEMDGKNQYTKYATDTGADVPEGKSEAAAQKQQKQPIKPKPARRGGQAK